MIAEIIGVGDGPRLTEQDADARALSRELDILGIELHYQSMVGAKRLRLQQTMAQALNRSDIIFTTGGLGWAPEDLTKEIICKGLSIPLEGHHKSLAQVRAYFDSIGVQMPKEAARMALLPKGSAVFPNDIGAAPGCAVAAGDQCVVMLPGDVEEAVLMLQTYVYPYLAHFLGATIVCRTARIFGVQLPQAESLLSDMFRSQNPVTTLYQNGSEVLVRVTARANTKQQAANMCTPILKEIVNRFGDFVYGIDVHSLEEVVITQLHQKGLRLAAAESCTGGLFASRMSEQPDSADVFCLAVAAQTLRAKLQTLAVPEKIIKKYGSVSERTAVHMACGAMDAGECDIGVAITGVADPDNTQPAPVGLVYIAVVSKNDAIIKKLNLGIHANAGEIRQMAVGHALNLVRLMLDYAPEPYRGAISLGAALKGKIEFCDDLCGSSDTDDAPATPPATGAKPQKGGRGARRKRVSVPERDSTPIIRGNRSWYHAFLPGRGDTAGEKIRKILLLVFLLVFLGSAIYLGTYFYESFSSKSMYDSLSDLVSSHAQSASSLPSSDLPEGYPADYQTRSDFVRLWEQNKDFKGWLSIDGTKVNYPVVQAKDNDFYLRRDFQKKDNQHGVPFLDYEVDVKRESENMIIYGHNMKDGQMFGELMDYKDPEYVREHPIITFNTVYGDAKYKVAAVFLASTETEHGPMFHYEQFVNSASPEQYKDFISQLELRSMITTGVDINENDKLISLSTCSYEYLEARFVVVGRLVREGEDLSVDTSKIVKAAEPLMPDVYYRVAKAEKPAKFANMGEWSPSLGGTSTPAAPAGPVGPMGPTYSKASSQESSSDESEDSTSPSSPSSSASSSSSSSSASSSTSSSLLSSSSSAPPSSDAAPAVSSSSASSEAPSSSSASSQKSSSSKASSSEPEEEEIDLSEEESSSSKNASSSKTRPKKPGDKVNIRDSSSSKESESSRDFWNDDSSTGRWDDENRDAGRLVVAKPDSTVKKTRTAKPKGSSYWADDDEDEDDEDSPPKRGSSWWEDDDEEEDEKKSDSYWLGSEDKTDSSYWDDDLPSTSSNPTISVIGNGQRIKASTIEILERMVQAEVGGFTETEALKAQAVAAYTYLRYNLASGLTPNVALSSRSAVTSRVKSAVKAVYGKQITAGGKPINASYFASCAGVTNDSADVWGGKLSYLKSVESPEDVPEKTVILSRSYVKGRLKATLNVNPDRYDEEDWFSDIRYCDNGEYVSEITLCGKTKGGAWTRATLLQNKIPSHAFDVEYDDYEEEFIFTSRGYGHGVGMSQRGAQQMARDGASYTEILQHYYSGVRIR